MNWTGGRLTRAARKADGSVINKQKQHFAKVRNTLLHGAKKSPAKWSIFDSITINVKGGSSERADNTPIRQIERSPSRHHHHSDHRDGSRKRRQEPYESEHPERKKRQRMSPQAPSDRHDKVKIKKEAYEASSHKLRKVDITDIEDEMEVLRRKKLKLLRESDWLGLGLQEPLRLKYAPTGVDDNIGRRRRLKPGHEARYDKSHARISPARQRNYDTRSEVRVTINGQERRVGVSSSAAPSKRTPPPLSSQSTEAMLLENDCGRLNSEPSYISNPRQDSRQQSRHHSNMASHMSRTGKQVGRKHETEAAIPWEDLNLLATEASRPPKLVENSQPPLSSSSIRKMAEARGMAVKDDEEDERFKSLFSSSQRLSSQGLPPLRPTAQQKSNGGHVRNNGRLIMPSSPPVLRHPVPRQATARVLRTNSLEIASSTAATVGEVPKLNETEEKEDKLWKDWLDEDAANGSNPGPGSDEDDREQSPLRSITPGVSQYAPQRAVLQPAASPGQNSLNGTQSLSSASARESNASIPHNMMRMSSSVHSTTPSASRAPSIRNQASTVHELSHSMGTSVQPHMVEPEVKQRITLPLTQRVSDEAAWKTFLQSPSELRFDAESPRPLQKPPIRRPAVQEKQKRKTPDPDAAWKSFVLTNDSDSEEENVAFGDFWKQNRKPATVTKTVRRSVAPEPSSSHASLEVHTSGSMGRPQLPSLPFSKPGSKTPSKPKSNAPFLSSSASDYFTNTQVLDDRSMYANQSQISSTTGNLETNVMDDRAMYANHSTKTLSSVSSGSGPFQLNKGSGQTMIGGFFKPPSKLNAKPPIGQREQSTFRKPVPFGTPQKGGKESFIDGLDKQYVQEANRELRKELWKKPNGLKRAEREAEGAGRKRQKKTIWDIRSSDDDHIEEI